MPYADVSQYVLASEAIPEIARCYFCGDTNKAESDARIAAQDGVLAVFRGTPFLHINRDRWHHDHIHWSSIIDPLYFSRADLLKIYPNLWRSLQSPDNETTLIAVPEGAPDSDTAQSDAIDVDTSGSDQTDAEIDVTQGAAREAEQGAPDDADTRPARSGARSKTREKPGKRVGNYHKPMCAALDNLCSNHGLDKVADWDWTHLRQRIERHPLFKGGYTLPEDSQFRKVCNEWFDKAWESGKYQNASR